MLLVVCVEDVGADQVGDGRLCAVSVDGAYSLSVEKSCGDPIYCCSVFVCLFGHVLGYVRVCADGLSEEDASVVENVVGV